MSEFTKHTSECPVCTCKGDNGNPFDILYASGRCDAVRCHWDGYWNGVGKTLKENYNTLKKVEELLSYGSMSALCPYRTKSSKNRSGPL